MLKFREHRFVFTFLLVGLFSVVTAFAAEFSLTKIGALDTGGAKYSDWWYTGTNPLLQGTGEASAEVTVKIVDQTSKVTADSSGNWSYQTTLGTGDYAVSLTQGSSTYAFTMHLGQSLPSAGSTAPMTTQQTTTSVPVTGSNQISAIGFALGIALLASYFYINGGPESKAMFERRMLKE